MLVGHRCVCQPRHVTTPFPDASFALIGFGPGGWGPRLAEGMWLTVQISLCGYAVGIVLGLLGAWAKLGGSRVGRIGGLLYTTLVRAVPELLLIILLYYSGTQALQSSLGIEVDAFTAAVVTLGFVQGAYLTEVFRGAIQAVPAGVSEAGRALALHRMQRLRLVTLPLALRYALPGMGNLWLTILKDSSLISVVGFSELLYTGQSGGAATKLYFFFYAVTAVLFLVLTAVSNLVLSRLGRGFDSGTARV